MAQTAGTTGEFYCPGCLAPVYLRQGEIKQPHFAHRAGAQCHTFSDNETPQHLAGKLQLATYCQKFGQVTQGFRVWAIIGVMYLILITLLTWFSRWVEKRMTVK
ncbi:hypothetical protein GQS40_02270|uniref:Competence protein CoiA-like N-terminal domain-containing protein n=1 Tax=Leuconostoc lactis TaxID=1246 RepID=A0A6L7A907_LEULA|nr:hypothetical protein [Leuconostoc lactis]